MAPRALHVDTWDKGSGDSRIFATVRGTISHNTFVNFCNFCDFSVTRSVGVFKSRTCELQRQLAAGSRFGVRTPLENRWTGNGIDSHDRYECQSLYFHPAGGTARHDLRTLPRSDFLAAFPPSRGWGKLYCFLRDGGKRATVYKG